MKTSINFNGWADTRDSCLCGLHRVLCRRRDPSKIFRIFAPRARVLEGRKQAFVIRGRCLCRNQK